jgi:hypothetical protein
MTNDELIEKLLAEVDEADGPHGIFQRPRNPDGIAAATRIEQLRKALETAREAIASLPEDVLGMVNLPDGWTGKPLIYPIRDELLASIDAALTEKHNG